MSNNNNNVQQYGSRGIGVAMPLFITFLVLKLTDVIAWSWWWVTAPLWILPAVVVAVLLVLLVLFIVAASNDK